MNKIFCLISKNNLLLEERIKELSNRCLQIKFQQNFDDFFLELQKNLNQKLIGDNNDLLIKNIEKLKNQELKKIISLLKEPKIKIIFAFTAEPTEFFSLLRKNKIKFELINIGEPKKNEVFYFLNNFLKKYKLNLSSEIINFLKENYTENFDLLYQDLQKIVAFGEKKLTKDQIAQLINLHPNIFKIQDFFLEKKWLNFIHNFKKFIIEDKSKNNYETIKILNLLLNSLIRIYILKNFPNKKIEGHYYYLIKLKEKVNKLNNEEIKKLILSLAKAEKKLKKFQINIKELPEEIYSSYLFDS